MVTIYLRYILDTAKLKEFEHYGKLWIPLVEKFGGKHHGYFMPGEGANNIALALFTFDSLAAYESYRQRSFEDPECQAAFRYAEDTRCIRACSHYKREMRWPLMRMDARRAARQIALAICKPSRQSRRRMRGQPEGKDECRAHCGVAARLCSGATRHSPRLALHPGIHPSHSRL